MNNETILKRDYKELTQKHDVLLLSYRELLEINAGIRRRTNKLRAEIRSLHRKLRDANRGAERLHLINAQLRIELVEYKIKHPEWYSEKIEAEFVTGTSVIPTATNDSKSGMIISSEDPNSTS